MTKNNAIDRAVKGTVKISNANDNAYKRLKEKKEFLMISKDNTLSVSRFEFDGDEVNHFVDGLPRATFHKNDCSDYLLGLDATIFM